MTQIYNKTKINIVVFDDKNKNKSVNASSNSKINPGLNTLNSSKMIS